MSVKLPEGISSIGERAFSQCSSLRKINVPSSAASIDESAFWDCKSLVGVYISKNNKNYSSVDGIVFNKNKTSIICYGAGRKADKYTIPSGVSRIGRGAFYGCTGLKSVKAENGVTVFGDSVFRGCSSLTKAELPDSVSVISFAMFRECSSLRDIKLPAGITLIDNFAFYGCTSLKKLDIPDGCTSIGNFVFYDCKSMKYAEIPGSVDKIGYGSYGFYYDRGKSCDVRDDDFILYGSQGGAAEKYADESNLHLLQARRLSS